MPNYLNALLILGPLTPRQYESIHYLCLWGGAGADNIHNETVKTS